MRQSKLKNFIILKKDNSEYLYGKIYNDSRFPNGHLILTTKIQEIAVDNSYAITENKTYYKLENQLTQEEFINLIKSENTDKIYANFLLKPLKEG